MLLVRNTETDFLSMSTSWWMVWLDADVAVFSSEDNMKHIVGQAWGSVGACWATIWALLKRDKRDRQKIDNTSKNGQTYPKRLHEAIQSPHHHKEGNKGTGGEEPHAYGTSNQT